MGCKEACTLTSKLLNEEAEYIPHRTIVSRHADKVFEIENCVRHALFENEGDV